MLTNLHDAFREQSRSSNMVQFDLFDFSSECATVTLLRYLRCCDLQNRVRGPSRSLEISPFDRAYMISYWRSIETMTLSRVVSEILNVEKCRDLEFRVTSHSRSLKVVPFDNSFLLLFHNNFVPFWDIRLQKCVTLKTGLGVRQGHWKRHHSIESILLPIDVP